MKIETHPTHSISWVDLAAKDLDAQVAFYTEMMGWSTFQTPGTPYTMFMVGESPVAGAMAMTPEMGEMPSVWTTYVAVDDAAATCAKAAELGGTVFQEPFDIPNDGKIAVIADPAGAVLGLFQGSTDNGMRLRDEPGAPCWFETISQDADAATAFYAALFGWDPSPMEMDGPMSYTVFALGEDMVGGCMQIAPPMPDDIPSHWQVSFSIEGSAEEFAAKATEKGAQLLMGPMPTDFGTGVTMMDPAGATFVAFDRSTGTQ